MNITEDIINKLTFLIQETEKKMEKESCFRDTYSFLICNARKETLKEVIDIIKREQVTDGQERRFK